MTDYNLSPEEVQELRSKKHELTEYGKQKIRELMNDGKLRFYDKGKETFAVEDPYWGGGQSPETQLHIKEMTHEEMLEEAARREKENQVLDIAKNLMEENKAFEALDKLYDENSDALKQLAEIERNEAIVAKVSDEDLEKVMDAAARQELAKKSFEELTRDERIKLALEEVDWIVIGGQDGEEFYGSIQFLRKVLRSLR